MKKFILIALVALGLSSTMAAKNQWTLAGKAYDVDTLVFRIPWVLG